jgi:3-hydroxyacyl-CoA dehydrogenase
MASANKTTSDILTSRPLRRVVVLGANGTMGYQSGALFAGAGVDVTFLARTKEKAEGGREGAANAVRAAAIKNKISVGSYDDLADAVKDADLVFEALAENFDIKAEIFEKVDAARRDDAMVATVSSGLSITDLAAPRSESFQKNFCGLHFFNPPQVIVGTELIGGEKTDPEVLDFLHVYSEKKLGRMMIRTANTAGFAGNRVGFKVLNEAAQLAEEHGPLLIDKLVGPYTGRALSPLATIDLVGWDVHKAIVDNVVDKCAETDEVIDTYKLPAYMQKLIDQGVLGTKSGGGFFKRDADKQKLVLDIATGEYKPASEVKLPELPFVKEVAFLHSIGDYKRGMECFLEAKGPEAELARKVIAGYVAYSFNRVGEVTETITGIDGIMASGFNWAPPSYLVDLWGLDNTIGLLEKHGLKVAKVLREAKADTPLFNEPRLSVGKYFVGR